MGGVAVRIWIAVGITIGISCVSMTRSDAVGVAAPPKPVFLYAGPDNDDGWNQAVDLARIKLESNMHSKIPYAEIRNRADTEIALKNFINQGDNIVIGDSNRFASTFKDLGREYGNVVFINIADNVADAPQMPNLRSVYGRSYESQYLCGVVAGEKSKSANIGFLALRPSPITNWEINGYTLGVLKANPKATVHVAFIGQANAETERVAALALIAQGADVVGQSIDGPIRNS